MSTEATPLPREKPSQLIRRMADIMLSQEPVKTGDPKLDIVVRQLQHLAAHADSVDAYLDSLFATPAEDGKEVK